MNWLGRARAYGAAAAVIDLYLGEDVRRRAAEAFSRLAGPLQRAGLRDPWEVMARALRQAGVPAPAVRALQVAYLLRTGRLEQLADGRGQDEAVVALLREWGLLDELHRRLGRGG